MKIVLPQSPNQQSIGKLRPGTPFMANGQYYVKLDDNSMILKEVDSKHAISIKDGLIQRFSYDTTVAVVDAEFVVK